MRSTRIARNLLAFVVPSFVPILILSVLMAFIAGTFVHNEDQKNNHNTLIGIQETMDSIFSLAARFAIDYSANQISIDLKNVLSCERLDYKLYLKLRNVTEYMRSQMSTSPHIASIYIYIDNDRRRFINDRGGLFVATEYFDHEWFDFAMRGDTMLHSAFQMRDAAVGFVNPNRAEYMTLYHSFVVPGGTKVGVVVVNLKKSGILSALNRQNNDANEGLFIADEAGNLIYQSDRYSDVVGGERFVPSPVGNEPGTPFLVARVPSTVLNLEYGTIKLWSVAYALLRQMLRLEGAILLASLVVGFLLALRNARRLQRSLRRILSAIQTASAPAPLARREPHSDYDYIEESILEMLSQQDYLQVQLSEKKYRLQVMELLALQSQIHPHFLNNALQTIYLKAIGLTGGHNDVSLMLEHLMVIMRHSLSDPTSWTPLSEEIRVVRAHIALEQKQFGNQLIVEWSQQREDFAVWVPRLILQPLVENCIRHGMNPGRALTIGICIRERDGELQIEVRDDGKGMDAARLADINAILEEQPDAGAPVAKNIGLINTARRLKLTFPGRRVIAVQSKWHEGTVVTLFIPLTAEKPSEGGTGP